jgi:regulator of sigma E protease
MTLDTIRDLLIFLFMLGSLILCHEFGHFLLARRFGVKIKEFGLGLPPRLLRLGTIRGTLISLNWIPLGGFVLLDGEFDNSRPETLASKPPSARLVIYVAGAAFNLILGYLILSTTFMLGFPERVKVVEVDTDSPASQAGLLPEDIVLQVDGTRIQDHRHLQDLIYSNLGQPLEFQVQRGGRAFFTTIAPRTSWPEGQGPAGFRSTMDLSRYPLGKALRRAFGETMVQIHKIVTLPAELMRGGMPATEARLLSPLGLKQVSDRVVENTFSWREGFPLLLLAANLNFALGLTNLLPLPALDGGRIFFVLLELLRGKALSIKLERVIHGVGMVALLGLMLVLTIRDVLNPLF